ncbi:MAG TPA: DUF1572 family protein [Bacteroidota bacterium]|nr:DUF1572 family protein [Bacteroidota bacterium]
MPDNLNNAVAKAYITYSRNRFLKEYYPRIEQCVNSLSEDDVWWRAHETDNSIGNLILHLTGNVRQWIVSGIGGAEDKRNRPKEFAEREHLSKSEILARMKETLLEADKVLAEFDVSKILEVNHIQRYDVTYLDAISHVVEHFAQHTAQIIYITKLRTGKDMKFYDL